MDDLRGFEVGVVSALPDTAETVILADGDYPSGALAAALLADARRVVCCDGAAAGFVERGGVPWAIVGDCDSLAAEFRERWSAIVHHNPDQESNDLTKAVRFCIDRRLTDIIILGATGRREDHTLGNVGLLADYAQFSGLRSVRMVTDRGVFDVIVGPTRFFGAAGDQVSIFCPDPQTRVTTANLRYPLKNAQLRGWWQGTLNEALAPEYGIAATSNALIYRLL